MALIRHRRLLAQLIVAAEQRHGSPQRFQYLRGKEEGRDEIRVGLRELLEVPAFSDE